MKSFWLAAALLFATAAAGAPPAPPPERTEVLDRIAEVVETRYFDAVKAREIAAALRSPAVRTALAAAATPADYATAVTHAMRDVAPDLHLRLTYEPDREFAPGAQQQMVQRRDDAGGMRRVVRTGRIDGRGVDEIARTNFGVASVEHLEGNVGYLGLTRFVPADLSRETLRAAIALLAHSDAVVIDLRGNIGGAPDAVAELASAFLPTARGAVELHVAENRAMDLRDAITSDPALSRPKLAAAPLYVLTDGDTASAAEMFATIARRERGATLVGARTAGAGNGGAKHSVGRGYALFLSEWRVLTGPAWEGRGIEPDVAVEPAEALPRALELARAAVAKPAALPAP